MSDLLIALIATASGAAAWAGFIGCVTWWFNRRVRMLADERLSHRQSRPVLPVSRRAGGKRARCQSPAPQPAGSGRVDFTSPMGDTE